MFVVVDFVGLNNRIVSKHATQAAADRAADKRGRGIVVDCTPAGKWRIDGATVAGRAGKW
jgi:hypothetical protein